MIQLRPYQQKAADDIRAAYGAGKRAPFFVLPTGGGKTVLFSYITEQASHKGNCVLVMCHRSELIQQISTALANFEVRHQIIAPQRLVRQCQVDHFVAFNQSYVSRDSRIYVASVQTLIRRDLPHTPDLIVCDEAHHLTQSSTWGKICLRYPSARILPVSATPCRLDGKGLGVSHDGFADSMIYGPTMRWLIDNGYLSDYRIFAPPNTIDLSAVHTRAGDYAKDELVKAVDKPRITGDAIDHYLKLARGKRAIVFCVSVSHAEHVCAEFTAAGIQSASLDGTMDMLDRRNTIQQFRDGVIQVLTSCDIVSEGFDLPAIECAILLRPTQSLVLYLQQVGRALRAYPGKQSALILDHVGNVANHRLPDMDREWSLDGIKKRKKGEPAASVPIRCCPACFAVHKPSPQCPSCGHVYDASKAREIKQVDGTLAEITEEQKLAMRHQKRLEERDCRTLEDWVQLGRSRGYQFPVQWGKRRYDMRQRRKHG